MEEDKYEKINSSDRKATESSKQKDGEKYDQILEADIKSESSIFEVIKVKEYTDIIKNILKAIEDYSQDLETIDDYPYFRGIITLLLVQNMCKFIPKLNVASEIFSERQLREVNFLITSVTREFALLSSIQEPSVAILVC